MKTPEAKVKAIINKWLREHDIWYFMPVQTGYGTAALDYFCCWYGHFVALEAKAGTEVTARQEATMRAIYRAGGTAWVVGSETDRNVPKELIIAKLEEIDAFIRQRQKSTGL